MSPWVLIDPMWWGKLRFPDLTPKWKTGDPTEDGYYWLRRNDLPGEPLPAQVVRVDVGEQLVHYTIAADPVPLDLLSDTILDWYGPLKEPT